MSVVRFKIVDTLYKTEPLFVIGCTHADLDRYLRARYGCNAGEDIGQIGQMLTLGETWPPLRVVWAKHRPTTPARIGVVVHEIFHLVTRICADKGIPIRAHIESGESGDEPAAYLVEFFATKMLERVRRS